MGGTSDVFYDLFIAYLKKKRISHEKGKPGYAPRHYIGTEKLNIFFNTTVIRVFLKFPDDSHEPIHWHYYPNVADPEFDPVKFFDKIIEGRKSTNLEEFYNV